ncbi:DUF4250 domain-containing protein, partial [bacterium]|nr:DUF4250 domain-containing protein [bacterium]
SDAARAGFSRKKHSLSTRFSLIHGPVMNLKSFETMDPHLLVGLINTELRNNASSLDDLCKTHGLNEKSLTDRLAGADYHFSMEAGQFR